MGWGGWSWFLEDNRRNGMSHPEKGLHINR